jgi:CheY-like chemotaxis protein
MSLILIVEDDPENLKLVRDTLQATGYQSIEAETVVPSPLTSLSSNPRSSSW